MVYQMAEASKYVVYIIFYQKCSYDFYWVSNVY